MEQSPQLVEPKKKKKTTTYYVGNSGPSLEQAQKCGGV